MESLHKKQVAIVDLHMKFVRGSKYLLLAWTPIVEYSEGEGRHKNPVSEVMRNTDGVFDLKDFDRYAFSFKISHSFDQAEVLNRITEGLVTEGYEIVDPPVDTIAALVEQGNWVRGGVNCDTVEDTGEV